MKKSPAIFIVAILFTLTASQCRPEQVPTTEIPPTNPLHGNSDASFRYTAVSYGCKRSRLRPKHTPSGTARCTTREQYHIRPHNLPT